MRVRSVDRRIDTLPDLSDNLTIKKLRGTEQPEIATTRRGRYTGDLAFDPLEVQAWPKGAKFMGHPCSLPERRVIWWLLHRANLEPWRDFEFQPPFLGGRIVVGGLVPDFAIYTIAPGYTVLWEVEGTTWHVGRWKEMRDEERRQKLLVFPQVLAVISIKEVDVNRSDASRNRVCEAAMRLEERG